MIVIATLSSERALALPRNRYEIIFHDCFTTVIANRLIYIGSAVGRSAILRFFLSTYRLVHRSNTKDSRISVDFGTMFVTKLAGAPSEVIHIFSWFIYLQYF